MKICHVSRKSLFLYIGIFFCMLFFEEARLTPLLEREGANYPLLLTLNQQLHALGEKTKISAFNAFMQETAAGIAQEDFLSSDQNLSSKIAAWWENVRQAEENTSNTSLEKIAEQEAVPQKEIKEHVAPQENSADKQGGQEIAQANDHTKPLFTDKSLLAEEPPLTEKPLQNEIIAENSQSETTLPEVDQEGTKREDSQNPLAFVPEQEIADNGAGIEADSSADKKNISPQEEYSYNGFNYPFNAKLVTEPGTANGIACYETRIPDYGRKKRVLIIGDSMMMEGLGPTLQNRLRKRDNLEVHREGKYSSGLSRPDFYNWFENLPLMLDKYQPDLLIMSLGANDTQDIVIDKKRYFIDTKAWAEIYLQRAKDFIALADNGKRQILWVSLPVMGKEPYFTRTKLISKLQAEASETVESARFINIEHLLTENGKYTTFYTGKNNQSIRLRSKDLIHVSNEGGEILTDYVLPAVEKDLAMLYANDMPVCYPPVAGMANRVVFTSSLRQKQAEYYIWLPETKTSLAKQEENDEKAPLHVQKTLQAQLGNKRYPVLYLLHGATGSGKDYVEAIGKELQEIANTKKVIIVAPSCEPFGWYVDSPLVADNQIAGFITKELIPHIDSLYPTTNKRAITGLSMGGHGALLLGFHNRNLFQSMASVSGVLDIRAHKDNWKIKNLLGELAPENQQIWDDHAVNAVIAKKWPATSPRHILVVTGTEDRLVLDENRQAQDLFHKRGFHIDYMEAEGTHNWDFWKKHIPEILAKQADFLHKQ